MWNGKVSSGNLHCESEKIKQNRTKTNASVSMKLIERKKERESGIQ